MKGVGIKVTGLKVGETKVVVTPKFKIPTTSNGQSAYLITRTMPITVYIKVTGEKSNAGYELTYDASAKRVMYSITDWIQRKLGLKVNVEKTRITRPGRLKYLGFGFYKDSKAKEWICRPHKDSVEKFKRTLKKLTNRSQIMPFGVRVQRLSWAIRGWINYFALGSMKTVMNDIDAHLRTRLRVIIWKQWKVPKKRQWGLQKLGIGKDHARQSSYMGDRYQWVVTKTCVVRAISKEKLSRAGLVSCYDYYLERHALKLC